MNCRRPLVLTTGGAGYIGSHTIVELLDAGYDTVIIDNFCNSNEYVIKNLSNLCKCQIQYRRVDLRDKNALSNLFSEFKFDSVIHFAAMKAVGESCAIPLAYYDNNVTGMINLLQVMAANNVKKMVYSSSCTVYGESLKLPLTEDTPVGSCTNPYGMTKYIGERILEDLSKSDPSWSIINLRYFNPAGAHESALIGEDSGVAPKNIFPCILRTANKQMDEVHVYGNDYNTPDGTGIRDYIHVVDLAQGHIAAMKHLESFKGLKSYNLGTGTGYSVLELIKAMEKASGRTIKYTISPRRSGDVASVFADTTLAAKELNWKATRGLPEMCSDSWRWHSQNPNGYTNPSELN